MEEPKSDVVRHQGREHRTSPAPESMRRALWKILSDGELHSWRELFEIAGVRYNARLTELRSLGYQIATHMELDSSGGWYQYVGRTSPRTKRLQIRLTPHQAIQLLNCEIPEDIKQLIEERLEAHRLNSRREKESSKTDRFAPISLEEM